MNAHVQPYLFFEGRAEEAIAFYQTALGAELLFSMRFRDNPDPEACQGMPPDAGDKIQHAELRVGGTTILISDGNCQGGTSFQGFGLSLSGLTEADAEAKFNALAERGQVFMPLGETFFASHFGMVTDRFGVMWMVMAGAKEAPEGTDAPGQKTEAAS